MNLLVKRTDKTGVSTIGELLIDGEHFCFTLEPPQPIPLGAYPLTIRHSPRFQRDMPHVENVPGHEGILIHWGNWAKDTEGCLLVGITKGVINNFIGESKKAFEALFMRLSAYQGAMTICYTDSQ